MKTSLRSLRLRKLLDGRTDIVHYDLFGCFRSQQKIMCDVEEQLFHSSCTSFVIILNNEP